MKTLVAIVTVAFVATSAPKADALFLGDLFNKAKNAITKLVGGAAKTVKNVVTGLGKKAVNFGKQALEAAGGVAKRLLTKVHDTTTALTGKAKDWLVNKGKELAGKLPGVIGDWVKKGVTFGTKATDVLEGKIHDLIHKGITWGQGWVDKGVALGTAELEKFKGMLMERAKEGLALVRQIARGKTYVKGMVNTAMAPKAMKLSDWLKTKVFIPVKLPGPPKPPAPKIILPKPPPKPVLM